MDKIKQGFSGNIGSLIPLLDKNGKPLYKSGWLWARIPLFDYRVDKKNPLVYTDKEGTQYSLKYHIQTDGGSIPPLCQIIPFAHLNPLNFPRAYMFHDQTYQYGGIFVRYYNEETFKFRLFTRTETDGFMPDWLYYDGANWFDRRAICTGLAAGSWTVWGDSKHIDQKVARVADGIDVYDRAGNLIEKNSRN